MQALPLCAGLFFPTSAVIRPPWLVRQLTGDQDVPRCTNQCPQPAASHPDNSGAGTLDHCGAASGLGLIACACARQSSMAGRSASLGRSVPRAAAVGSPPPATAGRPAAKAAGRSSKAGGGAVCARLLASRDGGCHLLGANVALPVLDRAVVDAALKLHRAVACGTAAGRVQGCK